METVNTNVVGGSSKDLAKAGPGPDVKRISKLAHDLVDILDFDKPTEDQLRSAIATLRPLSGIIKVYSSSGKLDKVIALITNFLKGNFEDNWDGRTLDTFVKVQDLIACCAAATLDFAEDLGKGDKPNFSFSIREFVENNVYRWEYAPRFKKPVKGTVSVDNSGKVAHKRTRPEKTEGIANTFIAPNSRNKIINKILKKHEEGFETLEECQIEVAKDVSALQDVIYPEGCSPDEALKELLSEDCDFTPQVSELNDPGPDRGRTLSALQGDTLQEILKPDNKGKAATTAHVKQQQPVAKGVKGKTSTPSMSNSVNAIVHTSKTSVFAQKPPAATIPVAVKELIESKVLDIKEEFQNSNSALVKTFTDAFDEKYSQLFDYITSENKKLITACTQQREEISVLWQTINNLSAAQKDVQADAKFLLDNAVSKNSMMTELENKLTKVIESRTPQKSEFDDVDEAPKKSSSHIDAITPDSPDLSFEEVEEPVKPKERAAILEDQKQSAERIKEVATKINSLVEATSDEAEVSFNSTKPIRMMDVEVKDNTVEKATVAIPISKVPDSILFMAKRMRYGKVKCIYKGDADKRPLFFMRAVDSDIRHTLYSPIRERLYSDKSGLNTHPILHSIRVNHELSLIKLMEDKGKFGSLEVGLGSGASRMKDYKHRTHGMDPDWTKADLAGYTTTPSVFAPIKRGVAADYTYCSHTFGECPIVSAHGKVQPCVQHSLLCDYVHFGNSIWYLSADELKKLAQLMQDGIEVYISGINPKTARGSFQSYDDDSTANHECEWMTSSALDGNGCMLTFSTDQTYVHSWVEKFYEQENLTDAGTIKFMPIQTTVIQTEDGEPTLEYITARLTLINQESYTHVAVGSLGTYCRTQWPSGTIIWDNIPGIDSVALSTVKVNRSLLADLYVRYASVSNCNMNNLTNHCKVLLGSYHDKPREYLKTDILVVPQLLGHFKVRAEEIEATASKPVKTLTTEQRFRMLTGGAAAVLGITTLALGFGYACGAIPVLDRFVKGVAMTTLLPRGALLRYTGAVTVNIPTPAEIYLSSKVALNSAVDFSKNLPRVSLNATMAAPERAKFYATGLVGSMWDMVSTSVKGLVGNLDRDFDARLSDEIKALQPNVARQCTVHAIFAITVTMPLLEEFLKHTSWGMEVTAAILAIELLRDIANGSPTTALCRTALHIGCYFLPFKYAAPIHGFYNLCALLVAGYYQ